MKQRFFRGQQFFQILFLRAVFFQVNPVCFRLFFVPLPLKDARIACAIFRAGVSINCFLKGTKEQMSIFVPTDRKTYPTNFSTVIEF